MKTGLTWTAFVGLALTVVFGPTPPADGGVITYIMLNPNTADAETGLDPENHYTHLLDFGTAGPATVNGVEFTQVTTGNVDAIPGFSYTVNSGARSDHAGNGVSGVDASQEVHNVLWDFIYNGGNEPDGVATISLSGLSSGAEYETRIYSRGYGTGRGRTATFDFDTDGIAGAEDTIEMIDQNRADDNPPNHDGTFVAESAYMLSYRFTAASDALTVSITEYNSNLSWHVYGLTNEEFGVASLAWNQAGPGNWDSPNWIGGDPGDVPHVSTDTTVLTDVVTVAADASARSLTVDSGGIAVADATSLMVGGQANFAAGTTLALGSNAAFSAGGGVLDSINTAGDATLRIVYGQATVVSLSDGGIPGTITKQGSGTLTLNNDSGTGVSAGAETVFRVAEGTLQSSGVAPLDQAALIELTGGTLRVDGRMEVKNISSGFDDATALVIDGSLPDPDYTISPGDLTATVLPEAYPIVPDPDGVWIANSDASKWIGFDAESSDADPGDYDFTTTVSLEGFEPATAQLAGSWSTDNAGLGILINGVSTGVTTNAGFGALDSFGAIGMGLFQEGDNTITFRFNNAEPGFNPAGLRVEAGVYSNARIDLTEKTVAVDGGGTLDLRSIYSVDVGPLVMKAGVLTTTGTDDGMTFASTTIDAGATDVGFRSDASINLGPVDGNGAAAVIAKDGLGDLILDQVNVGLDNATFDVQQGRLIAVQGADSFNGALLRLGGGELVLASNTAGADVVYDDPLVVEADSTLTLGSGGVGQPGPLTVTLGGAGGVALNNSTLSLQFTDDYALNVAGPISGNGGLSMDHGDVTLSGGGELGIMAVSGGTLNIVAGVNVATMEVTGGTVSTGDADRVTVSESLSFGDVPFRVEGGDTFTVRGSDLLAETDITLGGGTVIIGFPTDAERLAKNISTGFDDAAEQTIAGGQPDPDYTITPGDLIATVLPEAYPVPPWVANTATSKWIGFDNAGSNADPDDYDFTIEVSMDGWAPESASVSGQWSTDNGGLDILVNGESTGSTNGGFDAMHDFSIDSGYFEEGLNTITFRFHNAPGDPPAANPAGLRVDAAIYATPKPAPVEQENVNVVVTAPSTIQLQPFQEAALGNLTLDAGLELTIADAGASFNDVTAGAGASIISEAVLVRGTLSISDGPGMLSIDGEMEFDDDAEFICTLAGDANDLVEATADIFLGGALSLQAVGSLGPFGDTTRTILRTTDEEAEVLGTFEVVPTAGDHLGHGVFHRDVTANPDGTSMEISVFQAAAGDADGNGEVNNGDLQAILGAGSFGTGTGFDWTQGDFNGDTEVNNSDLQLILATGFFGGGSYAAVAPNPTVVPEPGTLLMLAGAAGGLLLWSRRRRVV